MLKPPVYQEDSPYQQVRIREDDLFRYLVLDRTFHAVMWKAEPVTLFLPYSQLMVSSLALVPEAKRALVLGHGGGSFAKWLAQYWPDLELDVVEFDPVVVRMAEDYFSYRPPSRHHVYVRDARAYLNGTTETYDLVWVDAFARHLVPFHLTTQEFFSDLRKHLAAEWCRRRESGGIRKQGRSGESQSGGANDEAILSHHRNLRGQRTMAVQVKCGKSFVLCRRACGTQYGI